VLWLIWVAQRFTAAVLALFLTLALATEGDVLIQKSTFFQSQLRELKSRESTEIAKQNNAGVPHSCAFFAQELALSAVEGVGFHGRRRLASRDRNRCTNSYRKFRKEGTEDQILRSDIVAQPANAGNIVNRGITRSIVRWIHLVFSIPILGYIYSPFDKIQTTPPQLDLSFFL